MVKGKRVINRSKVDAMLKKSKHRYNLAYSILLNKLTKFELAKMKLMCERFDVRPYELRDREFKLITTDRTNKRLFKRLKKHRAIYDSCSSVLSLKTL